MNNIKIAGAALNQTPLDWEGNLKNILTAIDTAKQQSVGVLCLPALCLSGYGCEDAFHAPEVAETALDMLADILPHSRNLLVALGLPLRVQERLFNAAALLADGEIVGFSAKQFPANRGIHYESRWFSAWQPNTALQIELSDQYKTLPDVFKGKHFPFGDLCYEIGGLKIGIEICEDALRRHRSAKKGEGRNPDLILNPSASPFAFGKFDLRRQFVCEQSDNSGSAYLSANLLGNEAGRIIYDGSVIIAASGTLKASGEQLSFCDCLLTAAPIDFDEIRSNKTENNTEQDRHKDKKYLAKKSFCYPKISPNDQNRSNEKKSENKKWTDSKFLKEESFFRAVSLGLFDYMRKSFSRGFVISLSGGADSAAVLCCCYLMIWQALRCIGIEKFKEKLAYFGDIRPLNTPEEIAQKMITTVYQATENSSETTRKAAQKMASALHATFYSLDVNPLFRTYCGLIEEQLGRKLAWETDDLALQNVQARLRAPSVWMLANIKNALLLASGNRSEVAVGYATMDGDTCGGLSPIAGVDKNFIRKWLRWLENYGPEGVFNIPALQAVNTQQPTAELRPQTARQTDEAELMPYEVLEFIETAAIGEKKMPLACYKKLCAQYPEHPPKMLKEWVRLFFRRWAANQWKRERYAPGFHLDDRNLDPKSWCRFPILSGNFKKELAALEKYPL